MKRRALVSSLTIVLASLVASGCATTLDKVRAQLPEYRKELARARQQTLEGEIKVEIQDDAGFRKKLKTELDKDLPEAKAQAIARALGRLGLLPERYDLRGGAVDALAGQAAAYYDPTEKTFYLLKTDGSELELRTAIVHELDHALQDARFDLTKLRARALAEEDEDRENALTFLVEGEATFVMNVAALEHEGIPLELACMVVESEAAMSRDQLLSKNDELSKEKSAKEASRQARRMPLYVYRTLIEPYTRGATMISYVYRKGGWTAVDELFRNPPSSTEQCLHPEKLVARELPVRLKLPEIHLEGWTLTYENTLGELGIDCLVHERLGPGHEQVAPGWAGDRYLCFSHGSQTAIVWLTTWDTEDDAREMEAASAEIVKNDLKRLLSNEETSRVVRRGQDVVVLLEVPADAADKVVESVLGGTKRSR